MRLSVNGEPFDLAIEPRRTLADALRLDCGLTGTHVGCEHGVCGACTVLLDGEPVRACLVLAVQAEGSEVRTVEGLEPGALQAAFAAHGALQCGFCTPGFLLLATALLEREPDASDAAITDALGANLCRCTGYSGIIDAVRAVRDQTTTTSR